MQQRAKCPLYFLTAQFECMTKVILLATHAKTLVQHDIDPGTFETLCPVQNISRSPSKFSSRRT
jgi:hypothetical protein